MYSLHLSLQLSLDFLFCSTTSSVLSIDHDYLDSESDQSENIDDSDIEVAAINDKNRSKLTTTSSASSAASSRRSLSSRSESSPRPKKRKQTRENELEPDNILKVLMHRATSAETSVHDHIHDFLMGYASTLRKFPPVLLAKTKRKIANIICDAEVDLMQEKEEDQLLGPLAQCNGNDIHDDDVAYIVEEEYVL